MPDRHSEADDELADARFLAQWLERIYVAYPSLLDGVAPTAEMLRRTLATRSTAIGQHEERHHSLAAMIAPIS